MKLYLLLLLLEYLCFCIAVDPTESSDWKFSAISSKNSFDNCTQCDEREDVSCKCSEILVTGECLVCCADVTCCICEECIPCWSEQRQLIIMTEIVICTLFAFGIIGLVIVYCKICNRARHTRTRRRRTIILHEARDLTQYTIEGIRERPPSYNEVVRSAPVNTSSRNNAPPLYTSPYNRTSMQEAPPSYPGTPKPQEKSQDSNEPPFSLPHVAQHM